MVAIASDKREVHFSEMAEDPLRDFFTLGFQ